MQELADRNDLGSPCVWPAVGFARLGGVSAGGVLEAIVERPAKRTLAGLDTALPSTCSKNMGA